MAFLFNEWVLQPYNYSGFVCMSINLGGVLTHKHTAVFPKVISRNQAHTWFKKSIKYVVNDKLSFDR